MTAARQASFDRVIAEVYEPLQRYLHRRCAPADFDDVFNDALLTVWRRLDDIPEDKVLPWAYGVARRSLANSRRGTSRRLRLVDRAGSATGPAGPSLWESDREADLHTAIADLSETDREVVRLWAWEQLEPREIAHVLETTPNAISVRLARIRRRLESELTRQNQPVAGHEPGNGYPEWET
jgi:RNA polymerase sigma-70 factor (ECF subfamily)